MKMVAQLVDMRVRGCVGGLRRISAHRCVDWEGCVVVRKEKWGVLTWRVMAFS